MMLLGKFGPLVDRLMKVSRPARFATIAALARGLPLSLDDLADSCLFGVALEHTG